MATYQSPDSHSALIHKGDGLGQDHVAAQDRATCDLGLGARAAEGEAMGFRQRIQAMEAHIMAVAPVAGARVAQTHDQD
jgi:hypothetical protein